MLHTHFNKHLINNVCNTGWPPLSLLCKGKALEQQGSPDSLRAHGSVVKTHPGMSQYTEGVEGKERAVELL